MIKELLTALAIPIVEVDGWEGDDILGTLAARGAAEGMPVLLVTGDKDALPARERQRGGREHEEGHHRHRRLRQRRASIERYGVAPGQVADFLGLKGDTSDNIPGVPGVGEKTAAKLLQQYGTLDAVLEHADEINGKLGENIRENTEARAREPHRGDHPLRRADRPRPRARSCGASGTRPQHSAHSPISR